MSVQTKVSVFDTNPELWEALIRIWEMKRGTNYRWVSLLCDGVELTFFEPTEKKVDEVAA